MWDIKSVILYLVMASIGYFCISEERRSIQNGVRRRLKVSYAILFFVWLFLAVYRYVGYESGIIIGGKKYLSRVLSLYVIWNIIYLPITIFGFKENNMSFARYVLDCIRGFLFIGQQFYSWQLWYLLSVFFVIASICIMAEHKIKDKNIFKIMMAIFLMGGGIGVLTTVDFSEYRKIEMVIKCIKFIFGNGRILSGFGYIAVGWIVAKKKILSGRISIILGLILLGALYLAVPATSPAPD